MSQATASTTTPPLTIVCSGASSLIIAVTIFCFESVWIIYHNSWHSGQCHIQIVWSHTLYFRTFLILLPGSIVKFGFHSCPIFSVSWTWFLLVWLVFMALHTSLWHRISNSLPWACLSLFLIWVMAKPDQRLEFLMFYSPQPQHLLLLLLCRLVHFPTF